MIPTTYISDCYDDNVQARYAARILALIPDVSNIQFVSVRSCLEASGNLVDVLDSLENVSGLIFVNIAPRGTNRWPNGTPFGHLIYNNSHIFTTIEGENLSLLQKLTGNKLTVERFDIPTSVPYLDIPSATQEHIINSQFRSFDFLPRIAAQVLNKRNIPWEKWGEIPPVPAAIWWQDNFGNFKTTLLPEDIGFKTGKNLSLRIGTTIQNLTCYNRLKDIPYGQLGLYIGSSGLPGKRLLEITRQKGDNLVQNHTASLPLSVGDLITVV